MVKLSKPNNRGTSRIYGYDYWGYVGYDKSPCDGVQYAKYTWECVAVLGFCGCSAGERRCTTVWEPPEICF
jgi:hypothetical protein